MSEIGSQVRSRRSLLAALTGGVAAFAAQALARPERATAGTIYVELGGANNAVSTTSIINGNTGQSQFALIAQGTGAGAGVRGVADSGIGVMASSSSASAVFATSTSGYGVYASSESGRGVGASSDAGHGLFAESFSDSLAASVASGRGNATGVLGYSGPGLPPAAPVKTGVYGYAVQDGGSNGVFGTSATGTGVRGTAGDGYGVRGFAQTGIGVYAEAGALGIALRTVGRLELDCSGRASVLVGTRGTTVSPGRAVDTDSRILCTLESDQGGLFIHRLTKNVDADTFRIILSQAVAPGKTATVAWFLIG